MAVAVERPQASKKTEVRFLAQLKVCLKFVSFRRCRDPRQGEPALPPPSKGFLPLRSKSKCQSRVRWPGWKASGRPPEGATDTRGPSGSSEDQTCRVMDQSSVKPGGFALFLFEPFVVIAEGGTERASIILRPLQFCQQILAFAER